MNPTRHLTIIYFVLFVSVAALMGCATVNLGSSVPTTALAFASPDGQFTVNDCPERTSAKIDVTHSFLVSRLYYLDRALPPSIRQTAVVNAMFAGVELRIKSRDENSSGSFRQAIAARLSRKAKNKFVNLRFLSVCSGDL